MQGQRPCLLAAVSEILTPVSPPNKYKQNPGISRADIITSLKGMKVFKYEGIGCGRRRP